MPTPITTLSRSPQSNQIRPENAEPAAASEEGLVVCDRAGVINQANARAAALLGVPHANLPGSNIAEILAPVDAHGIRPWWREAPPANVALRTTQRTLAFSVRPLHGRTARSTIFLLAFAPPEEGAISILAAWENSLELAYACDAAGRLLAVNPAFARKFGRKAPAWIGTEITSLVNPDDQGEWRRTAKQLSHPPYRASLEQRWHSAQGWRWLAWEKTLIRDARGNAVAIRAVGQDITKRKLAEEQYLKLARAVEQSPIAIIITDAEGNVQYVNIQFTASTGYTLEDLMESRQEVLRSGHEDAAAYQQFWNTLRSGKEWAGELKARTKSGQPLWESVRASTLRNPAGEITHVLCMRENITNRKHLEDQLRQAQKMESLGTLAGGIAHDFNNMLAIVSGYTEMCLNRSSEQDAVLRKSLREIQNATERATGLVKQILTFSRKADTTFAPVDLNAVIRDLGRLLSETFPRTVTFHFGLDDKLPSVLADQNQLLQVLMNLCVNARDAMPEGGTIGITTHIVENKLIADSSSALAKDCICIKLSDTGLGMSPEVKPRIFEPFFTTKQTSGGTGLGLAVVYGIVLNHHGMIEVESTPGKGTTFIIHLPLIRTVAERLVENPSEGGIPHGCESLLIVEDESSIRNLLQTTLTQAGYQIVTASDGLEAVDFLMRDTRKLDAVLLDLNLPGFHGVEVFKQIRKRMPDLPILVMSGNITQQNRIEMGKLGAYEFLQKPFRLDEIGRSLQRVLAKNRC